MAKEVPGEDEYLLPVLPRPLRRSDCLKIPRPCPFVSCHHNLYLDVNPYNGSIKLNFPHLEPGEMGESCSLDVADRSNQTMAAVGGYMNLTLERVRQTEERLLDLLSRDPTVRLEMRGEQDDGKSQTTRGECSHENQQGVQI